MESQSQPPRRSHRVLLVDDEELAREGLRRRLSQYPDFEIIAESSHGEEAVAAIESQRPEVVFLDVQMPGMDGFQVLEAVGAQAMPIIVFVTAFDEYAVRAFQVHALDYLLKPVTPEAFQRTLERVRNALESSSPESIATRVQALLEERDRPGVFLVREGPRLVFVPEDTIQWFEAADNYVRVHTKDETYLTRRTLSSLEAKLDRRRFARIHRSSIVNLQHVKELTALQNGDHEVLLRDGRRLGLSRRYRKNLDWVFAE